MGRDAHPLLGPIDPRPADQVADEAPVAGRPMPLTIIRQGAKP
jgi:hypothetical protein